jgi:PBP1b-binding outer membrane lipoprotein LpoB
MTRLRRSRLSILALALLLADCASNPNPADVQVLQTGSTVLQAATALQKGITASTDAKVLPVPLAQKLTGYVAIVSQKSGLLENAVQAYHAATTVDLRKAKAAEIQQLLTDINSPIAQLLNEALPDGAVRQLTLLVGNVMSAVASVQRAIGASLATSTSGSGQ